jgi:hypothetical protein
MDEGHRKWLYQRSIFGIAEVRLPVERPFWFALDSPF